MLTKHAPIDALPVGLHGAVTAVVRPLTAGAATGAFCLGMRERLDMATPAGELTKHTLTFISHAFINQAQAPTGNSCNRSTHLHAPKRASTSSLRRYGFSMSV